MKRAISLDVFRGYAIVTMVLSGTIASGVLPGWMYHAQMGPRSNYTFDPQLYGITWVDLVFPFFLFAMGAAIPFSVGGKIEKGENLWKVIGECVLRGIRLTFFCNIYSAFISMVYFISSRYYLLAFIYQCFCIDVSYVRENTITTSDLGQSFS